MNKMARYASLWRSSDPSPDSTAEKRGRSGEAASAGRGLVKSSITLIGGKAISGIGTNVTTFGLDVWLYQVTGSYTVFILLMVLSGLPRLLLSPVAGAVADQQHKGSILLTCELASLATIAFATLLYGIDRLTVEMVAIVIFALSLSETFRWPTFVATIARLTPADQLTRANGIDEILRSGTIILGPIIGIAALRTVGLLGMLALGAATFAFGVTLLLVLRISSSSCLQNPQSHTGASMWNLTALSFGFRWILLRRGFRQLLLLFACANCALYILAATQTPYILSFAKPEVLSGVLACDGVGVMVGGSVFYRITRHWNLSRLIVLSVALEAAAMFALGASRSNFMVCACAFLASFCAAPGNAASQTLWQSGVPPEIQGRVFAVRALVATCISPIALLVSIPLAQHVFEPLIAVDAASVVGFLRAIWGDGKTGAIGLMLSCLGASVVVIAVGVYLRGGLAFEVEDSDR